MFWTAAILCVISVDAHDKIPAALNDLPEYRSTATDRRHNLHIVYGDPETQRIYYQMRAAGSATFTSPVLVNGKMEAVIARERRPKIAVGVHGRVYILWQNRDGVICVRSELTGAGARFESVTVLDQESGTDVPNLVNDSAGHVYAVWVDHRHKTGDPLGAELFMAAVREDGSFGPNFRVSDEHYPVCPCCMPELACRDRSVFVVYRSTQKGMKEMILRRAEDEHLKWQTVVLSHDRWKYEGCPMSGPHIAFEDNRVAVVWTANGSLNAATSDDRGMHFKAAAKIGSAENAAMGRHISELRQQAERMVHAVPLDTSEP